VTIVSKRARMHLEEQEQQGQQGMKSQSEDATIPAAITDTGCERDLNEDRYAVIECGVGVAWIVCDGMGGTTGGELAAQLVIDAVKRDLMKQPVMPPEIALRNALLEANRVIVLRRQNQAFASMGTTAVALLFSGAEVALANVGDSRAYLIRNGAIQQLTVDHTFVQQLVERGEIRPEDALGHPDAHILTRCLGAEPGLEVDIKKFWVWSAKQGEVTDTVLLCSDGLYSLVAEMEIAQIVSMHAPQVACVKLVELAKARGGYDNITVSIIPLSGQMRAAPPPSAQAIRGDSVRKVASGKAPKVPGAKTRTGRGRMTQHLFMAVFIAGVAAVLTAVGFFASSFF
jgi:serine/threonine protein phosphatase PrpC